MLCSYMHRTVSHGRLGMLHKAKHFVFSHVFLLSAQFRRKGQWCRNSEPSFKFTNRPGNFQRSCLLPCYFNGLVSSCATLLRDGSDLPQHSPVLWFPGLAKPAWFFAFRLIRFSLSHVLAFQCAPGGCFSL